MVSTETPLCDFGWRAPAFTLRGIDDKVWSLDQLAGPKGTVVAFICNHCPYVKAIAGRLARDADELKALGVALIAINANDADSYPEDSFSGMQAFAAEHGFTFPYLHDESQAVARAYNAVCTPDFFGFDATLGLQYRGRLDASRKEAAPGARRELFEAMALVAKTGRGPADQVAGIGCSIKWREPA